MIGLLSEIIKGLPVNSVLRMKLSEYEAEVKRLVEANRELEAKLAEAEHQKIELIKQIEETERLRSEYVEVHGMNFRRLESGSYSETPCCVNRSCHNTPMSYLPDMMGGIAVCSVCKYKVMIRPEEMNRILKQLQTSTKESRS